MSDIRAAVIDDAPLEVELLEGLPIKILAGAYLQDSIFLRNKTFQRHAVHHPELSEELPDSGNG